MGESCRQAPRSPSPESPLAMRSSLLRPNALLLLALALGGCGKSGGVDSSVVLPSTGPPSALNYGGRVLNFEVGVAASYPAPSVSGADSTFAVQPDLPSGLAINADSGAISGTPLASLARTTYVVTASNSQGNTDQEILLQIGGLSRFVFAPAKTGQSFRVYGTQPDGESLYHHSWTEEFAVGGAQEDLRNASASQDGRVICGTTESQLWCWLVDPTSGEFVIGPPANLPAVVGAPEGVLHTVAVHPTGNYVYVASRTAKRVLAYAVNQVDASLSLVADLDSATQVNLIQVDPLGRYVLVRHVYQSTSNLTQVRSYVVNEDGSNFTETQLFTIPSSNARGMEIGALGEAVYFPLTSTATNPQRVLLHCGVNPLTGKLSLKSFLTAGTNPTLVRAAPNGKHLYVTDPDEGNINLFNIHGITRNLSLGLQDISVSATLSNISFSADGSELYMTDGERSEVVVQSVNKSTGAFEASTSLYTRPGGLRLMQAPGDSSPVLRASELYALGETGTHIKPFVIDETDGSLLDSLAPTLVPMGTPSDLAVEPRGRFLFTGSRSPNRLDSFSIQSSGEVTDLLLGVDLGLAAPVALAADPTGEFLYVACDNTLQLQTFSIAASGQLALTDTDSLSGAPTALTLSPGGEFLYVTIGGDGSVSGGQVSRFRADAADGSLTSVDDLATPGYPNAMAFNQDGTRAYLSLRESVGVRLYNVDVGGSLSASTETSSQPLPNHVSLTRDGRFAYVTFIGPVFNSDGLLLYEVDSTSGVLHGGSIGGSDTWVDSAFAGDDCRQSFVSHDGAQVYVLASGSDEIWCFDADSATGIVTFKSTAQPGSDPIRMAPRLRAQ